MFFNRRFLLKSALAVPLVTSSLARAQRTAGKVGVILTSTESGNIILTVLHEGSETPSLRVRKGDAVFTPDWNSQYSVPTQSVRLSHFGFSRLESQVSYDVDVEFKSRPSLKKTFSLPDLLNPNCRLAVLSCMSHRQSSQAVMWSKVFQSQPDMIFMIGDLVYADNVVDTALGRPATLATITSNYLETWQKLAFYSSDRLIPMIAVWDDHDLGWNNANKNHPLLKEVTELFRNFYPLPQASPRLSRGPGVAFRWDAFGRRFLFLDDRSFRDYSPGSNTVWGDAQKSWIENEIQGSPFSQLFIVNGVQFQSQKHRKGNDAVDFNHPQDFRWIKERALMASDKMILFVSGDVHCSGIQKIPHRDRFLWEITSSGLHSSNAHNLYRGTIESGQLEYCGKNNFISLDLKDLTQDIAVNCVSEQDVDGFGFRIPSTTGSAR